MSLNVKSERFSQSVEEKLTFPLSLRQAKSLRWAMLCDGIKPDYGSARKWCEHRFWIWIFNLEIIFEEDLFFQQLYTSMRVFQLLLRHVKYLGYLQKGEKWKKCEDGIFYDGLSAWTRHFFIRLICHEFSLERVQHSMKLVKCWSGRESRQGIKGNSKYLMSSENYAMSKREDLEHAPLNVRKTMMTQKCRKLLILFEILIHNEFITFLACS